MQVQNLNTLVDMARIEITEKYQPGEEETYFRLLKAAHIEEDTYFQHVIHSNIDGIIRDIKEAHRQDSTSAPDTTVAEEIYRGIAEAASFTRSPQENKSL